MKILIIDDEIRVATLLAESVTLQGHEAMVAPSGEEGLALVDQRNPDAIFLDIVMPGMSGLDVLRRIRQTHGAIPVIVITGQASSAQIDEARSLGVTDCIEKPFVLRHLNAGLAKLRPRKP